jgi:hypothetical protein
MPFNKTAWTALGDDDGSNTVGTLWTKTKVSDLNAPVIQTTTVTGAQNNFALTADARYLICNNAALVSFTGFSAGYDGQELTVISNAAGHVSFAPQSASSTAANRYQLFATVGLTLLAAATGYADFKYDATAARWRLVAMEQGAWITPAYATGNFAPAAPTWTVDAGDVTTYAYRLDGRTLTVSWYLQTTSVTLAPTNLRILIPAGLVAAKQSLHTCVHDDNGAGSAGTFALISVGGTTIDTYKAYGSGSFATATNTTRLFGTVTFEVQ